MTLAIRHINVDFVLADAKSTSFEGQCETRRTLVLDVDLQNVNLEPFHQPDRSLDLSISSTNLASDEPSYLSPVLTEWPQTSPC